MSELSDYLNARVPAGWTKGDVIAALADRVDRTTVYRYLSGRHPRSPSEAVLEAFASVLPTASLVELRAAAGQASGAEEPWVLPPEANRLNQGQRRAIEAFILATVAASDPDPLPVTIAEPASSARDAELGEAPIAVTPGTRGQLEDYIAQLYNSGRVDLAERLAATLAISSASDTASKSASD